MFNFVSRYVLLLAMTVAMLCLVSRQTVAQSPNITSFTPTFGCAESAQVVITGSNFTNASAVKVGGTHVSSFTVNTSTQITATIAAGVTGVIAITTPNGTGTSSGTFTINPLPTANLTPSAICAGNAVTITTNNDATQVEWQLNGTTVSTGTSFTAVPFTGATVAGGNGGGSAANQLLNPYCVFVDNDGNVYVSDFYNHRIQKWAPGATFGTTVAGGNGSGSATNQLNSPTGLFVDGSGNVYIADYMNNRIQKWAPGATSGTTVAGGNGYGTSADQLAYPFGVYVDGSDNVFVAEFLGHRISKWAPGATSGTTAAGGNGEGAAANQLDSPSSVFVDGSGNIYVADYSNYRIQKWESGATSGTTVAGGNGFGSAANQLANPSGVFVDESGNVYVSDAHYNRIQKWAPGATSGVTVAGGNGEGPAANQLENPVGVFVDDNGNIYIADYFNHRVQKWAPLSKTATYTPTSAGSLTAIVSNGLCSVTSAAVSVSLPAAGITNNTGTTILSCSTTTINITATGGTGYAWSGGTTPTTAANSFTEAGTYIVTVTDNNGCTATASIAITGNTLCPDCTGTPGGTALPGTACNDGNANTENDVYGSNCVCAGTPMPLDCLGVPNGTALPGTPCNDGLANTENDVYGSNCVCAGTLVNTLCNLGATLNGNTNICAGGVLGLIATGGNQYQWSGPNSFTQPIGGSITRTNATLNMSGIYTVTITNNVCVDILSIEVTVHPKPSATLSGTTAVCSGGTISITAPAGATTYQWSGPGGFTANTNSITRTNATTTMSGLYKVTVTNAGGCTASGSRTVTVSMPTIANVSGATAVCAGSTLALTCTTAGVNYLWSGPGGFAFNGASMTRTPAVAGTYTVTVSNAAGCISIASRNVTINAVPYLNITNNSTCTRIYLTASGGNSYSWSGPNGFTANSASVNRNPATAAMFGVYTVTVTGTNGCTATASITVNPCSGKTTLEETAKLFSAYPNPSDGLTTIAFTATNNEQVLLSVFNIEGKEVAVLFDGTTEANTNYEIEFDMSRLPPATYYAVLHPASGQIQQIKLMMVR